VFNSPYVALPRYDTVETQWIKFFRKTLLIGENISSLSDLAITVVRKSASLCYCHRKLFSTEYFSTMPVLKRIMGCKWDTFVGSLYDRSYFSHDDKRHITIGICAYNEEYIIEKSINSIFSQYDGSFILDKVIVVSSGSDDNTDKIIEKMCKINKLIHPIYQKGREGKNSAVNEIIRNSESEIIVLFNADNVLASEYALDMLIRPFESDDIGMTGGHPIPTNCSFSLSDYAVHLMWAMHHNISLQSSNMGELIAFRNNGIELPIDMQGDEAIIRYNMEKKGLRVIYVPTATVYNKGPSIVNEFIKQRKRVNVGELNILRKFGLQHSTHTWRFLVTAMYQSIKDVGYVPFKTINAVFLEYFSRLMAIVHVKGHKNDIAVWEQIKTTKKL